MSINSLLGMVNSVPDMWKYAEQQGWVNPAAQQAQQAQLTQAVQNSPIMQLPPIMRYDQATQSVGAADSPVNIHHRSRELFLGRMGGVRNEFKVKLGDFVQCHVHAQTVYLFYCFGDKAGVTSESIDVFPSDQLIAQFRMVLA